MVILRFDFFKNQAHSMTTGLYNLAHVTFYIYAKYFIGFLCAPTTFFSCSI